jgi:magnesium-protoporphyrin O-methyltransferase
MDCCQCQGIEIETVQWAEQDLQAYRKGETVKTTTMLTAALLDRGVNGLTLLDIGGGVGAIQLQLLAAGAARATSVEASTAYLDVARKQAMQAGLADRISALHGDFVDLAPRVGPADIVTLDRVICCYHDARSLVSLSAAKALKFYGLVYPRDRWPVRLVLFFENLMLRLRKSPFRSFVHPTELVDHLVREAGLRPVFQKNTFAWQVVIYERP